MNERIEQCLYQAGLTAQGCWDELDDYAREGIEKFAELIIKECADLCSITASGRDAEAIEEAILKHFGVEE